MIIPDTGCAEVQPNMEGWSSRRIKKHMIAILGERCMDAECAWDFDACPVSVELDHMDGDAGNNSQSNLRLLCPNCHSLTPNFTGRNRGKGTRTYRNTRYAEGKSF